MHKIEIKGTADHLHRIAVFLSNNHINHDVVEHLNTIHSLEEMIESIEWPL